MSVTGLQSGSFQNLVLNEGAFLVGFDYSTYTTAATLETALVAALTDSTKLLGATIGGGSFVCKPEIRAIEIDGLRGNVKGATRVDSWDVRLTGTLKEITSSNMTKLAMCGEADSSVSNMTKITIHPDIASTDYIANLCWVGSTSAGYVIIALTNVLNTAGITMTFKDKDEASVPFEFVSHATNPTGGTKLPVEIIFLSAS